MRNSSRSSSHWSDDNDDYVQIRSGKSAAKSAPKFSGKNASSKTTPESEQTRKLAKRGLRIGRSPVGKAVFATRRIFDGTCIGEIEGEVICDDEYRSRYAFDLENGAQLEPAPPFRFVNHSCEPNCAFDLIGVDHVDQPKSRTVRKLLIFAINDIESGDELTIDYNWPASFAIPCNCKTPSCRGWIVSKKSLERLVPAANTLS
ncbi:MAG: SET domain-containing protein-lysine N-methyltransferase [Pirellulaceae bacterium]|nr:SET domain-containing protein-lysine N-methyltransferase [Pirellulaceae bacterium]